jgi:hypothetical protein
MVAQPKIRSIAAPVGTHSRPASSTARRLQCLATQLPHQPPLSAGATTPAASAKAGAANDVRHPPPAALLPRDGLFRPGWEAAFDQAGWERDGFVVLPDVLTDDARERWLYSLQRLQGIQDALIALTPWNEPAAWAPLGLAPREPLLTAADVAAISGGSECGGGRGFPEGFGKLPFERQLQAPVVCGGRIEYQGILPEHFPAAYDTFIMDITCRHPQFLALQRRLLTPPNQGRFPDRPIRYDHSVMLSRKGGSAGRRWHAHPYDARDSPRINHEEGPEPFVDAARMVDGPELMLSRTLCFPAGIAEADGGLLGLIPGATLFRDPFKWAGNRTDWDADMEAGWMAGKSHPADGAPLRIVNLALPAGSLVCFPHHMPHSVTPRGPNAATRWGQLLTYRTVDEAGEIKSSDRSVLDAWVAQASRLGVIDAASATMFAEF